HRRDGRPLVPGPRYPPPAVPGGTAPPAKADGPLRHARPDPRPDPPVRARPCRTGREGGTGGIRRRGGGDLLRLRSHLPPPDSRAAIPEGRLGDRTARAVRPSGPTAGRYLPGCALGLDRGADRSV